MLPTPAIRSCDRRKAFTGAFRPAAIARRASAVNSGLSGSGPRRDEKYSTSASWPSRTTPVRTLIAVLVGRDNEQVARHAQVHQEVDLVLELPDQVLAAAREPLHAPPPHGVRHLGRRGRLAPARVEDLEPLEHGSLDGGSQLAADRLDLGQFGHRRLTLACRP